MPEPRMARITCDRCNAWYSSERDLRAHMETAHRTSRGPVRSAPADTVTSEESKPSDRTGEATSGCATSFLTEERNERNAECGEAPKAVTGEYKQPDAEKEAGGEG
jgi:hypothetical protein